LLVRYHIKGKGLTSQKKPGKKSATRRKGGGSSGGMQETFSVHTCPNNTKKNKERRKKERGESLNRWTGGKKRKTQKSGSIEREMGPPAGKGEIENFIGKSPENKQMRKKTRQARGGDYSTDGKLLEGSRFITKDTPHCGWPNHRQEGSGLRRNWGSRRKDSRRRIRRD